MKDTAGRSLLLASCFVMTIDMAAEVIIHPHANDHVGSVTGLVFVLIILGALVRTRPQGYVLLAAVLSGFIAIIDGFVLCRFILIHHPSWDALPDLVGRIYFVVVVPLFAVRYFVVSVRALKSPSSVTPNGRWSGP